MANQVDEKQFEQLVINKISPEFKEKASEVFKDYGQNLSFDVTNVLMHAIDQDKVGEVLKILEKHFSEHLQYQHPDIRGVRGETALKTKLMFNSLCETTLGLKAHASA